MKKVNPNNNLPLASQTAKATANLEKNKKSFVYLFGYKGPLAGDDDNFTERANYFCDGHRMLIDNPNSISINIGAFGLVFFVLACLSVILTIFLYYKNSDIYIYTLYTAITGFIFSFILYRIFKRSFLSTNDLFIFDRDTGNVYLPKKFMAQSYVLPFSELELYTARAMSQHGMNQYRTYLYPKLKPKGQRACSRYALYFGSGVIDAYSAKLYWNFISTFMDKTKDIPDVYFIKQQLAIFKHYDKTMDDIPFEGYDEDAMETLFYET